MYNYGDHEINYKEDFHRRTHYLFSFSYHKITLFEKKYDIKLNTLISMYLLWTWAGSLKIKMQMHKLLFVIKLFRFFA